MMRSALRARLTAHVHARAHRATRLPLRSDRDADADLRGCVRSRAYTVRPCPLREWARPHRQAWRIILRGKSDDASE
eukprot:4639390-Prymnesium_polylepis.1